MKNLFIPILALSICIPSLALSSEKTSKGNGKKVYADYHGVRYTRQHDGCLGRWEMYADTEKSKTGRKTLCYNADIILENGQHDIAAPAYPQVGMQSNLDPDYIEYQILSAKAAKIDGFFIEWGYMLHENDILLRAMQKVAAKYRFEIGVNWCDGWLYYNWITKLYPEINNREKKTEHYVRCYQYLVDSVLAGPTAPMVNGQPVFYLFGPGAQQEEYKWAAAQVHIPDGMKQPAVLRRWADWGKLENNKYIPVTKSKDIDEWTQLGTIPTAWLPARVRPMDSGHPYWDNYALSDDLIEFMKPFRDSIWTSSASAFTVKSGFVMPGMDNRGCAGWGRGHFFYIPRDNGQTYSDMWQFCLASKDSLDMMFIASWSDYTEGHEIEPTIENGDRELRSTLKYAAQFKGERSDENGIALPLQLFNLRKQVQYLSASSFDVSCVETLLDKAAYSISDEAFREAKSLLNKVAQRVKSFQMRIALESVTLSEKEMYISGKKLADGYDIVAGLHLSLPNKLLKKLMTQHYTGTLCFDYLDTGFDFMELRSQTIREPKERFEIVGRIKADDTRRWKRAQIELYKENIHYMEDQPVFRFTGKGVVRNLQITYNLARNPSAIWRKDAKGVTFADDHLQYRVEFLTSNSVRILSLPLGDTLVTKRLVISESLPRFQDYTIQESEKELTFFTDELLIKYDRIEKAFRFFEAQTGKLLLKEKGGKQARSFKRVEVGDEQCFNVVQRFIPISDEALYGLGQYQNGVMNYRGDSVLFLQANMDVVNPFLISTNGYGILWDNYSSSRFKDDTDGYSFTSEVADASDYYFVYGKDMDAVVAGYRELTGQVPMFGKWVYGFWQSKERYKSFDELEAVVKEYRNRKIPLDNIVQDWEYWGDKPHWNSLKFDPKNFDHPKEAIGRLHQRHHVHFMLSVWPGFGPETEVYAELDSIKALFNEPTWAGYKVFDAYNPVAREIFWKNIKAGLYNQGVDAWWMDATEPSFKEGFTQLKQEEKTKSAGRTHIGTFHRYLNVYSLELLRSFHAKLRKESDEKRVFILSRSAFAGQQQYATAIWSGDVSASWENLHKQITAGLNLSMSGIPYWTSDTGGFFVTEREAQFPEGLKSDEYKELYSRWFQFSAFTPLLRAHGTNVPREIWQFGTPGTPYYDNQLKYIQLRYRLLPYIYSLSHQVTSENYTLLRGLAMDFTDDHHTYDVDNAYMFGSAFLVRPVLQPLAVVQETETYLPLHKGKYWYNFWSDEAIEGGKAHRLSTPLDVMPLYVKGGSILPLADVKQYAMESPDTRLEIRVYRGTDASFLWYDDEGDSYRYEKGACSTVRIDWQEANRRLVIAKRCGNYPGMVGKVQLTVRCYAPGQTTPIEKQTDYTGQEEIILSF